MTIEQAYARLHAAAERAIDSWSGMHGDVNRAIAALGLLVVNAPPSLFTPARPRRARARTR